MRAEDDFPPRETIWKKAGGLFRRKKQRRGPGLAQEDRKGMEGFIKTRNGVEAYLEPSTMHQSPTVVLVASDGEWTRFSLPDVEAFQKLARKLALPVYDVSRVGYPKRMRDYRRGTD
jgi:hypothetical protein